MCVKQKGANTEVIFFRIRSVLTPRGQWSLLRYGRWAVSPNTFLSCLAPECHFLQARGCCFKLKTGSLCWNYAFGKEADGKDTKSWAGGPSSLSGRVLTNRQMKRFSTPLVIRETLIKATARCYWGPIRMAKTKTKWIVSKADQDPEHTNLLYTAGGMRHLQGKWHGMCNNAVCGEKT